MPLEIYWQSDLAVEDTREWVTIVKFLRTKLPLFEANWGWDWEGTANSLRAVEKAEYAIVRDLLVNADIEWFDSHLQTVFERALEQMTPPAEAVGAIQVYSFQLRQYHLELDWREELMAEGLLPDDGRGASLKTRTEP